MIDPFLTSWSASIPLRNFEKISSRYKRFRSKQHQDLQDVSKFPAMAPWLGCEGVINWWSCSLWLLWFLWLLSVLLLSLSFLIGLLFSYYYCYYYCYYYYYCDYYCSCYSYQSFVVIPSMTIVWLYSYISCSLLLNCDCRYCHDYHYYLMANWGGTAYTNPIFSSDPNLEFPRSMHWKIEHRRWLWRVRGTAWFLSAGSDGHWTLASMPLSLPLSLPLYGYPYSWMVYKGKFPSQNGWFRVFPILGNPHIGLCLYYEFWHLKRIDIRRPWYFFQHLAMLQCLV